MGLLNFSGPPKFFWEPKFFWTKNFFRLISLYKFCGQILLRTKNFWPKLFRTRLKFCRTKYFGPEFFALAKKLMEPKKFGNIKLFGLKFGRDTNFFDTNYHWNIFFSTQNDFCWNLNFSIPLFVWTRFWTPNFSSF